LAAAIGPLLVLPCSVTLRVGTKPVSQRWPSEKVSLMTRVVKAKKSEIWMLRVYSRVSPGLAPGAPVSLTTATPFWMAMDLSVQDVLVGPAAASLVTGVPGGSRGSIGVQVP
jgi:hypothetical protein